jgi:hypothetical protein
MEAASVSSTLLEIKAHLERLGVLVQFLHSARSNAEARRAKKDALPLWVVTQDYHHEKSHRNRSDVVGVFRSCKAARTHVHGLLVEALKDASEDDVAGLKAEIADLEKSMSSGEVGDGCYRVSAFGSSYEETILHIEASPLR